MKRLVTVEEACEIVTDGTHYTPKNAGVGIPFLTVKDVTYSELDFINCSFITIEDFNVAKEGNSAPQKGDVLFSKDGTVGKVHVVTTDKPFAILSSLAILRPKQNMVDATYLGHVLRSHSVLEDALKRKTGSAIRRIILSDLKKVKIPLPSLEEQRRIADILDRAEALRAKRRASQDKTNELIESIFIEMFGDPLLNPKKWDLKTIEDVAKQEKNSIVDGPFGASLKTHEYVEQGIPVIRINNIRPGWYYNSDFKYITEEKYNELIRSKVLKNDILMARVGNTVGKCCLFDQDYKALLSTTGVCKITCNQNLT